MDQSEIDIEFRNYVLDDKSFVFSSWIKSLHKGRRNHSIIRADEFTKMMRPKIDAFFDDPNSNLTIAYNELEPDVILGWIATSRAGSLTAINYVFVKHDFRKCKIASQLINHACGKDLMALYTTVTDRAVKIMVKNPNKYKRFKHFSLS